MTLTPDEARALHDEICVLDLHADTAKLMDKLGYDLAARHERPMPRVANMLVKCYVRDAAAKAGILSSHQNGNGELVEDDPRRFGFHNLRHSLASFLVRTKTDPKTGSAAAFGRTHDPATVRT